MITKLLSRLHDMFMFTGDGSRGARGHVFPQTLTLGARWGMGGARANYGEPENSWHLATCSQEKEDSKWQEVKSTRLVTLPGYEWKKWVSFHYSRGHSDLCPTPNSKCFRCYSDVVEPSKNVSNIFTLYLWPCMLFTMLIMKLYYYDLCNRLVHILVATPFTKRGRVLSHYN